MLYWMGGARRMDGVVELPEKGWGGGATGEGIRMCQVWLIADISPGNHNLTFFPTYNPTLNETHKYVIC